MQGLGVRPGLSGRAAGWTDTLGDIPFLRLVPSAPGKAVIRPRQPRGAQPKQGGRVGVHSWSHAGLAPWLLRQQGLCTGSTSLPSWDQGTPTVGSSPKTWPDSVQGLKLITQITKSQLPGTLPRDREAGPIHSGP